MEKENLVQVSELRKNIKSKDNKINNYSGVYKFWATKEDFEKLLRYKDITNFKFDCILPVLEKAKKENKELYCFYVGISDQRALSERIRTHINKSGGSSLNTKIKEIIENDDYNSFFDKLYISYEFYETPIKKLSTVQKIRDKELTEINAYLRILNKHDNYVMEYLKIDNIDISDCFSGDAIVKAELIKLKK